VVIESEPQGANIYIGGKEKGPFAQTPWSGSMDGEFQYLVEKRGYKSKEGRTSADPSKLLVLQIVLSEEDYLGWVEIKSNVPGASIFLDDKNVGAIGKTPFSGNFKPGKHKVWIEADGYEPSEHDIEVIAGEAAEISAQLKGAPVGYLYVRGPGIEASRIYLDGELLCERGPCRKPVKEGRHRVSVRRSGYKSYSTTIEVQAKTEINLKTELAKQPGRGDAVVAYIFAGLFAGGGIYLGLQAQKLEKELEGRRSRQRQPAGRSGRPALRPRQVLRDRRRRRVRRGRPAGPGGDLLHVPRQGPAVDRRGRRPRARPSPPRLAPTTPA
jgi:hypothetical protein